MGIHVVRGRGVSLACLPIFITACLALLILSSQTVTAGQQALLKLDVGGHRITAEIAATEEARDRGLMKRGSLPPDRGMLFVFPESRRWCMWMLDTDIPLSAAFIDEKGTIVNIAEMMPHTTTHHCAASLVRYVLEMNGGWFSEKLIGPGSVVRGLRRAPRGR